MKALIILFFLTVIISVAPAQQIESTIIWDGLKQETYGKDTLNLFHFNDAVYGSTFGTLPTYIYTKNISINEADNINFEATLSFKEVQPLTAGNNKIEGINNLTNDFKITHFVSRSRGEAILEVHVLPIRKNNLGKIETLSQFQINISSTPIVKTKSAQINSYADHSVLANGKWIKIAIKETGFYKLTYSDIVTMGLDPQKFRIFGNGGHMEEVKFPDKLYDDLVENAIWYELGSDGKFNNGDFVLFYAIGPNTWKYNSPTSRYQHTQHKFDNKAYYFLTSDAGEGKLIQQSALNFETPNIESYAFDDYRYIEPETKNLLHSGYQWFSDIIYPNENLEYTFNFPNILTTEKVIGELNVAARTTLSNSTFSLQNNNISFATIDISPSSTSNTGDFARMGNTYGSFTPSSENVSVSIKYNSDDPAGTGWLDYLRVTARRALEMVGNEMAFSDASSAGEGNLTRFHLTNAQSNIKVLDVTDWVNPIEMQGTISDGNFILQTKTPTVKNFVAFYANSNYPKPEIIGNVENQDLHGTPQTDYLIVVHPSLRSQADRLAELHRATGLTVFVTEPAMIYNEFSSGQRDITAIRWFAKMLYDKYPGAEQLKYLLLFGDGTYDNRITSTIDNPNLIPTFQSENSLDQSDTYISDDYFGLLDNAEGTAGSIDRVDIGIGRLPVQTIQQASQGVEKIEHYMSNRNCTPWKNSVVFIGDDEDSNIHTMDANSMADKVMKDYPDMVVNKIFLDAYKQVTLSNGPSYPEVNRLVNNAIENGVLLMNYSGHGGETGLAEEKVITMDGIKNYSNIDNLPIWVTATCEFSRYDLTNLTTAGEEVLLNPRGGGIALFTTTRLVYSSANFVINYRFFDYAFKEDANGGRNRLGDIFRLTKKATGTGVNKRKFSLLGDPALQLIYPTYKVKTSTLNGVSVEEKIDTLKALSSITITGHIEKPNGGIATNFNGTIYPQIYDKKVTKTTVANDPKTTKMNFTVWDNILFSGKAIVENGEFSFTFKVPKDINYSDGIGRIVYYATTNDNKLEANGHYENIIVGGFNENQEADNLGPDISIFLNSSDFKDGDRVAPSPLLFATFSDKSGINKTGSSIGHDIVAILDNDATTTTILNDLYEAGKDYTQGYLSYKFQNLSEGEHTLFLRVWDNYNNSSTKTLSFVVENDIKTELEDLYCFPNTIGENNGEVQFLLTQNTTTENIQTSIEIFDANGTRINLLTPQISQKSNTNFQTINWDLTTATGNKVPNGLYLYRVTTWDGIKTSVGVTKKLLVR